MQIRPQALSGLFLLSAERRTDDRGYFARIFDAAVLASAGLETAFPERSIASNDRAGTIRGLHFAAAPYPEIKIVRCLSGAIYDVAVDVRADSPTFGAWAAFELQASGLESLYIPYGFAHGYQTLTDDAVVGYDISTPYTAAAARGIRYDDPDLAIPWPLQLSVISVRDANLKRFTDAQPYFATRKHDD